MGTITKVYFWAIQSVPQYQARAKKTLDKAIVDEYAERYREGLPMDPVKVCGTTNMSLYVVDGHHRLAAMKQAGLSAQTQVEVEIVSPSLATPDVKWIAAGMNVRHGLRRTNDDKRCAAEMALTSNPDKPDAEIARHVGVSNHLIGELRQKLNLRHPDQPAPPPPAPPTPPPSQPPTPPPQQEEQAPVEAKEEAAPPPPPASPVPPVPTAPPAAPAETPPVPKTPQAEDAPKIPTCDRNFRPIPEELREFYARRGEVLAVAKNLSEIKEHLAKAIKANDPLWCEVTSQTIASLEAVIKTVGDCEPLYLCPACGGIAQEGCTLCGHRGGFIGHKEYEFKVKDNPNLMKYMDRARALHAAAEGEQTPEEE